MRFRSVQFGSVQLSSVQFGSDIRSLVVLYVRLALLGSKGPTANQATVAFLRVMSFIVTAG